LTQYGRVGAGTVSLGGNGQFTRLSALQQVGEAPWSGSLTEDLDLAISLGIRGWKLTSTARASVDQQGIATFRPLVRQRTRWYQGHMTAGRRLPEVFRSTKMTDVAAVEMALYLLVPWIIDLPWSILYHLILLELVLESTKIHLVHGKPASVALALCVWYLLGFWPALVTSILAKRRGGSEIGWGRAIGLGHAFVLTNYLSYLCCWRALGRMTMGRTAWTKTARLAEPLGAVAAKGPVPMLIQHRSTAPAGGSMAARDARGANPAPQFRPPLGASATVGGLAPQRPFRLDLNLLAAPPPPPGAGGNRLSPTIRRVVPGRLVVRDDIATGAVGSTPENLFRVTGRLRSAGPLLPGTDVGC
jgi:hypothetical protein